ncbi:MAG: hypothetical protein R3A48_14450 [Polyangiales bacterium]
MTPRLAATFALTAALGCDAETPALTDAAVADRASEDSPVPDVLLSDAVVPDAVVPDARDVSVADVPASDVPVADAPLPRPSAWVRVLDASFLVTPAALAVSPDGSTCVVGDFQGDLRVMGRSITSSGASDGFTACFDPSGALRFLSASAAPGDDAFTAAAADGDELLVAGHLPGPATLGSFALGSAGGVDAVVARFDRAGRVTRAVSFGGAGSDQPSALAVDGRGHVYVAGTSDQDLRAGSVALRNEGRAVAWLLELDASLTPLRGRAFTAGFDAQTTALRVSNDGAVTLGGQFSGSLTTGGPVLGATRAQDVFVIRIAPDGQTAWASRYGGGGDDRLHDLAVSPGGEVTLAGSSGLGRFAFGADEFDVVGSSDGWIARAGADGAPRWSRRVGGDGEDRVLSLFAGDRGGMAVGRFDRAVALGDASFTSRGAADAWRASFDEAGAVRGVAQYGGEGPDVATAVAAAPGGSVTLGRFAQRAVVAGEAIQTVGIAGAFVHRAVE